MGVNGLWGRREFGFGAIAAAVCGVAWGQSGVPARIVSTAPSATETLFALGLGRNVVGVSQYCEYPPEVKALPKVGSYVQPNLEAIARLRPDLVVLQKHEGPVQGRLRALGIRYVEMPYGLLADVYAGISVVADATGVHDRGEALNTRIQDRLAEIAARSRGKSRVRALVIVDRKMGTLSDLIVAGANNYVNQMMVIAGAVNVLDQSSLPMYPRISLETGAARGSGGHRRPHGLA